MKFVIILILIFSFQAFAFNDYKCLINNVVTANSEGELIEIGDKSVINKIFTVDRKTGAMAGPIKNNYFSNPEVLDYGSQENSFKVLSTMKNEITTNIYVLTVEEFADSSKKPFVFLSNTDVFYGYCEHF